MENLNSSNIKSKLRTDEDYEKESLFSDSSDNRNSSKSRSRDKSPIKYNSRDRKNESEEKKFIMKNGCCRDCMRAFSKTGKSCLCQVPKTERKYTLADKGCNFCGCHGCNPVDVRKDRRKEMKRQLRDDKNILYKKQRLLDSDDEELKIYQHDVDEWNKKRKDLVHYLMDTMKSSPFNMGLGVPLRMPSYILGYQPSKGDHDDNKDRSFIDQKRRKDRKRSGDS